MGSFADSWKKKYTVTTEAPESVKDTGFGDRWKEKYGVADEKRGGSISARAGENLAALRGPGFPTRGEATSAPEPPRTIAREGFVDRAEVAFPRLAKAYHGLERMAMPIMPPGGSLGFVSGVEHGIRTVARDVEAGAKGISEMERHKQPWYVTAGDWLGTAALPADVGAPFGSFAKGASTAAGAPHMPSGPRFGRGIPSGAKHPEARQFSARVAKRPIRDIPEAVRPGFLDPKTGAPVPEADAIRAGKDEIDRLIRVARQSNTPEDWSSAQRATRELARIGTEKGTSLQAFAEATGHQRPSKYVALAEKLRTELGLPELTQAEFKDLWTKGEAVISMPGGNPRVFSHQTLVKDIFKVAPREWWNQVNSAIYTDMLGNVPTGERNILGMGLDLSLLREPGQALGAGADWLTSQAGRIPGLGRLRPRSLMAPSPSRIAQGLKEWGPRAQRDITAGVDTGIGSGAKWDVPSDTRLPQFLQGSTLEGVPFYGPYNRWTRRLVTQGPDTAVTGAMHHEALGNMLETEGIQVPKGISVDDMVALADDVAAKAKERLGGEESMNLSGAERRALEKQASIPKRATEEALASTYHNENLGSILGSSLKNLTMPATRKLAGGLNAAWESGSRKLPARLGHIGAGAARVLDPGTRLAPFARFGGTMMENTFRRAGGGVPIEIGRLLAGTGSRRELMRAIGEGALGGGAIGGLGGGVAGYKGYITPPYDAQNPESQMLMRAGLKPNALDITALMEGREREPGVPMWRPGDKTIPLDWLPPVGAEFLAGGSVGNAIQQGKFSGDPAGQLAAAVMSPFTFVGGAPFWQGIKRMVEARSPKEGLAEAGALTVGQTIPSPFGQIARGMDPLLRETKGETAMDRPGREFLARIPGASENLPARQDPINPGPIERERGSTTFGRLLENTLMPTRTSTYQPTPWEERYSQYASRLGESGFIPTEERGPVPVQVRLQDAENAYPGTLRPTPDQRTAFQTARTEALRSEAPTPGTDDVSKMPLEEAQDNVSTLRGILSDATNAAKIKTLGSRPESWTERQQDMFDTIQTQRPTNEGRVTLESGGAEVVKRFQDEARSRAWPMDKIMSEARERSVPLTRQHLIDMGFPAQDVIREARP